MKFIRAFVCMLVLLQVSSAYSELDPKPDRMGIYFDLESFSHYTTSNGTGIMVPAYIVISNPTFSEIHRWEATLAGTGNAWLLGVEFEGDGINSGSDTEYHVQYETPLVCEPVTLLATVNFFLLSDDFYCLHLTGTSNPSLGVDLPVIWPEAELPVAIEPTAMYENGVGATLGSDGGVIIGYPHGCETIVGSQEYDWATIKAFYR